MSFGWRPTVFSAILIAIIAIYNPLWHFTRIQDKPDVALVLLNWSRFPNVQRIIKVLCSDLNDTVKEFLIWNNNPNQNLSSNDFECAAGKVVVVNSPQNEYFKARYLACLRTTSKYCFFQDDDFLLNPSVIRLMRHQIEATQSEIYLAPPDEILRSRLRRSATPSGVHTSFAWLGYGSMIPRNHILDFSQAMTALNMSHDEQQIADNYFSILRNEFPQLWVVTEPVLLELGGGQPFTVGEEGDERNNKYILMAARLLDKILAQESGATHSFVSRRKDITHLSQHKTPFASADCVLETTIPLLPPFPEFTSQTADEILGIETKNMKELNPQLKERYLLHPLSHAVDDNDRTFFLSPFAARINDEILLTCLPGKHSTRIEFLVDEYTASILLESALHVSNDATHWIQTTVQCTDYEDQRLCSFSGIPLNYVKIRSTRNWEKETWKIYSIAAAT